jgi:hypothetical protein
MKAIVVTVDNKDKSRKITNTSHLLALQPQTTLNDTDSLSANDAATNTGTAADSVKMLSHSRPMVLTDFSAAVHLGRLPLLIRKNQNRKSARGVSPERKKGPR